jgi:hypothetical protein
MIINILLFPFAVFGLAYLIYQTDGPFDIFKWFRTLMGLRYIAVTGVDGKPISWVQSDTGSFTAKLMSCFWCFSTWVAWLLAIPVILFVNSLWITYMLLVFASIGISGVIYVWVMSKEDL